MKPHEKSEQQLKQLNEHLAQLRPALSQSVLPGCRTPLDLPSKPTFTAAEKTLLDNWLQYLSCEESNPLEYDLATKAGVRQFVSRIKGIYKKAIVEMRFYAEIWCVIFLFLLIGEEETKV